MKFASKELEEACRKADARVISLVPSEAEHSQNSHFAEPAWPVLHDAAYYGLAGEVVRSIEPHSEADPVAILLQFLAAFGNAVGISSCYQIEGDKHRAKLFVVMSGATSKGRKGTALGRIRQLMAIADPDHGEGWQYAEPGLAGCVGHLQAADADEELADQGDRFSHLHYRSCHRR